MASPQTDVAERVYLYIEAKNTQAWAARPSAAALDGVLDAWVDRDTALIRWMSILEQALESWEDFEAPLPQLLFGVSAAAQAALERAGLQKEIVPTRVVRDDGGLVKAVFSVGGPDLSRLHALLSAG